MSFYIRLNKSVRTFDGLISAYVCFLKTIRESQAREEGRGMARGGPTPMGKGELLVDFCDVQTC
jgi:hypothetical protein